MTDLSRDEQRIIGEQTEKAFATTIENLFPETDFQTNIRYPEGDLDILVEGEQQVTFFEVKHGINHLRKAKGQIAKGENYLEQQGLNPSGKVVVYDEDFGNLLNSLDELGPFFSRSQLKNAHRVEGREMINSFKVPLMAPLKWVIDDWREDGERIGDDKYFNQFDYQLLGNFNFIEETEDGYRPTDHLYEVFEGIPAEEQIFHKTPRYDLYTSPFSENFEEDISESLPDKTK